MDPHYPLIPTPPGDWKNDIYALQSIRMAAIYNIIIRSMNSIIYHAHKIDATNVPLFIKYSFRVSRFIQHHSIIENFIFSILEVNPSMMSWRELKTWADLCLDIEAKRKPYQPDEFVKAPKDTGDAIVWHMNYTMPTLSADFLKKRYNTQEIGKFEAGLSRKNQTDMLPFSIAPLLMVNSDCTHNSWFPPVPVPIILFQRHVMIPLESGIWRFSQCDTYMMPKKTLELPDKRETQNQKTPIALYCSVGILLLAVVYATWLVQ